MRERQGESNGRPPGVRHYEGGPVRRALETYADWIVESDLEEAHGRLEASQSHSPETLEIVSRMATRINDGVLTPPLAALEDNPGSDVRGTAADLLGLDPERERRSD